MRMYVNGISGFAIFSALLIVGACSQEFDVALVNMKNLHGDQLEVPVDIPENARLANPRNPEEVIVSGPPVVHEEPASGPGNDVPTQQPPHGSHNHSPNPGNDGPMMTPALPWGEDLAVGTRYCKKSPSPSYSPGNSPGNSQGNSQGVGAGQQNAALGQGASSQGGRNKVLVCHVPPGNPANAHNILIGAPAVQAHLNHGDYLGACNDFGEPWDNDETLEDVPTYAPCVEDM